MAVVEPMLASGKDVAGCLMASGYDKLGAQEMFSGDYTVIEPVTIHGEPIAGTLLARDYKGAGRWDSLDKVVCIDRAYFNQGQNAQYEHQCHEDGIVPTLVSRGPSAVAHGVDCRNATEYKEQTGALQSSACHNMNSNNVVRVRYIVRRLTPLECERLQGFPDGWTDIGEWVDSNGKKHKEADSPRFRALGNSISLPPWKWVLKRLCACYERDATLGSLFDGIGGFPLLWEQINGKGSCLWASEIEEFPMAVTKLRFGG
jgi:site-specific DNA-cytosine methylase